MATTAAAAGPVGPVGSAPARDPRRRRALLGAAAALPVAAAAVGGYLATRPDPAVPVRMAVTLSPAGDGTLVRLTLTAEQGRLPDRLTAVLVSVDPGATERFAYTDLRLAGRRISLHDRAYSDQLVDLPAGGRSFELSYRVGPVGGHRVVVLPGFPGTERRDLDVAGRGGRVLQEAAGGTAAPAGGSPGPGGSAGGTRTDGSRVRLELVTG